MRATIAPSGAASASRLRPSDIPRMAVFHGWTQNSTIQLDGRRIPAAEGELRWPPPAAATVKLGLLESVVTPAEVSKIRSLVADAEFDTDGDSVDGIASHEMFVIQKSGGKRNEAGQIDHDPAGFAARQPLRDALSAVMDPILHDRIDPYVRRRFPAQCGADAPPERACTPCSSLVRRYRPGERRSHNPHRDMLALVTVVISLADYGTEYRGGLYVSAGQGRQVVALNRGDAVVHQSDLLHGVDLGDEASERWSWILWYYDSTRCVSRGHEWSKAAAEAGDAMHQHMYGFRLRLDASLSQEAIAHGRQLWMRRAADAGFAESQVAVGRLEQGGGNLAAAEGWFRKAAAAGDADASYCLAQLAVRNATWAAGASAAQSAPVAAAVRHLEDAARHIYTGPNTLGGAPFATYALGIAHLYGYGDLERDAARALEWFEFSGIPEGFMAVAVGLEASGRAADAARWRARAELIGFGSGWLRDSRRATPLQLHLWPTTGSRGGPPYW